MSPRAALPGPRQWIGEAEAAWPSPERIEPGQSIVACYAVLAVHAARAAAGDFLLTLELSEARGRVTGQLITSEAPPDWLRDGVYVGVRATAESGPDGIRLAIEEVSPLQVALEELALFLPRSPASLEALEHELQMLIGAVRDVGLAQVLSLLLAADSETGRGFRLAPAATRNHHAYLGGLLEHTVSVARLAMAAGAQYGAAVDHDLLLSGALLHDIGKVREIGAQAGFPYTDEGRLLGHILLGLQMVREAAAQTGLDAERLLLLEHLVASHQGRYEWQSPREPRTLEALILHYVDDLDAKVNQALRVLHTVERGWTDYDRGFGRELLRHVRPPAAGPERIAGAEAAADASSPAPSSREHREKGSGRTRDGRRRTKAQGRRKAKRGKKRGSAVRGRQGSGTRMTPERAQRDGGSALPGHPGFIDRDTLDLFAS